LVKKVVSEGSYVNNIMENVPCLRVCGSLLRVVVVVALEKSLHP